MSLPSSFLLPSFFQQFPDSKDGCKAFLAEISSLEQLPSSPYIVPFIGGAMSPDKFCVLTEFVPGPSLETLIVAGSTAGVAPIVKVRMMRDIARGMAVVHEHNIIHRNLKPSNIMVALHFEDPVLCQVTDFGFSRVVSDQTVAAATRTEAVGTPLFMAPEVLAGSKNYTSAVDVFSFAIICAEIWNGMRAYSEMEFSDMIVFMNAVTGGTVCSQDLCCYQCRQCCCDRNHLYPPPTETWTEERLSRADHPTPVELLGRKPGGAVHVRQDRARTRCLDRLRVKAI